MRHCTEWSPTHLLNKQTDYSQESNNSWTAIPSINSNFRSSARTPNSQSIALLCQAVYQVQNTFWQGCLSAAAQPFSLPRSHSGSTVLSRACTQVRYLGVSHKWPWPLSAGWAETGCQNQLTGRWGRQRFPLRKPDWSKKKNGYSLNPQWLLMLRHLSSTCCHDNKNQPGLFFPLLQWPWPPGSRSLAAALQSALVQSRDSEKVLDWLWPWQKRSAGLLLRCRTWLWDPSGYGYGAPATVK